MIATTTAPKKHHWNSARGPTEGRPDWVEEAERCFRWRDIIWIAHRLGLPFVENHHTKWIQIDQWTFQRNEGMEAKAREYLADLEQERERKRKRQK